MPFERRLAAALVLLLGVIPVMGAFFPGRPEGLVAPLALLVSSAATLLALRPREASVAAATVGSMAFVAFGAWVAEPAGLGHVALVPFAMALAGAPAWGCALGLLGAAGIHVGLVGLPTATTPSVATLADGVGLTLIAAWAVWIVARGLRAAWLRNDLDELHAMAETLEQGISRDAAQLWAVARQLTDNGAAERVHGAGLDEEGCNVATRVDADGTILAARIEGDMLATLTVGQALRACVRAGVRDPGRLREIAATELDEVNDPDDLTWIGVFDPTTDAWTLEPSEAAATRVRGPHLRFAQRLGRRTTREAITERLEVAELPPVAAHIQVRAAAIGIGLLVPAAVATALALAWLSPSIGVAPLVMTLVAHHTVERLRLRQVARYEAGERALEDRIDCRDDVHHGLARALGGLLPYQVHTEAAIATAHRLRGDVISGSFADMLVGEDGRLRVLAGEVAGEGIGAGFLSVSAQMALRCHAGRVSWDEAQRETHRIVEGEASVLRYPLSLELGVAEVDGAGVSGLGCLDRLVVHHAGAEDRRAEQVERFELDGGAVVYITPGASRAGPEDDAPTIDRTGIGERIAEILGGDFDPDGSELPSLFSEVFDGTHAPAHGTLIALRRFDPTLLAGPDVDDALTDDPVGAPDADPTDDATPQADPDTPSPEISATDATIVDDVASAA